MPEEIQIRPDFEGVRTQLSRLQLFASKGCENNHEDWPHLKNQEDFGRIYSLSEEETAAFEEIYGTGRDCSVWMSSHLDAYNDASRFPTLKSFVDSFNGTWVFQIDEMRSIVKRAKDLIESKGTSIWSVGQMIRLFESQINMLEAVPPVLESLKQSQIYQQETGIKPAAPMQKKNYEWLKNIITLVIALVIGLAGFFVLDFWRGFLWLVFVVIASPLILAFTQNASSVAGKNLIDLYRIGLKQLTIIGSYFQGNDEAGKKEGDE